VSVVSRQAPQEPRFHVAVRDEGGGAVVALAGELDLATVADAAAAIREPLARGRVRLDLRELEFMDSSGVHMLDAVLRDADREGWTLHVDPAMRPPVRRLLEITGLLGVLPFADTARGAP